ncbi:MAG TPA: dipeptidase PepE [Bacteroidales bacterium]|nr:dipeptidase PepE [Bacteroidales bacterium]
MNLLLISNSTNYKEPYLEWCMPLIQQFLSKELKKILFIPYAGVLINGKSYPASYDAYAERVEGVFQKYNLHINSIHKASDPVEAVNQADAIIVGGGNTFHLVAELHKYNLLTPIRRKVLEETPYVGWSAGSNIASPTLSTTNDMPIIMPKSFETLYLVPFQINPHFLDPYPEEINDAIRHGGETRQDRINEFLAVNQNITVVGLREASALLVQKDKIHIKGKKPLRIMRFAETPFEIKPETIVDFTFKIVGLSLLKK